MTGAADAGPGLTAGRGAPAAARAGRHRRADAASRVQARTQPGTPPRPPSRSPGRRRAPRRRSALRELGLVVVVALVLSLLVKTFLVQAFAIPSGSMEPTLHGCPGCRNDRILVDRTSTWRTGIHRGDVVVFRDPGGWIESGTGPGGLTGAAEQALSFVGLLPSPAEHDLVKRVIGVGGDVVEGRGGRVVVDGVTLDEPYVHPGDAATDVDFRVVVPQGSLWVMGDHRSDSADSRAHRDQPGHGFVPLSDVVGRAVAVVWPLSRADVLSRPATFHQPGLHSS